MDDVLTWSEIERRYPDEWVLLADVEIDESFPIRAGRVLSHSKDAHEAISAVPASGTEEGLFYTGALLDPGIAVIL